ncbi:MAG: hypothetical protein ACOH5I_08920 [Oligoflexus sp.]
MAARIGITPDMETSKWELERGFKNTRNWKVTPPFASKKEAQEWEKKKAEELRVKTVVATKSIDMKLIRAEWRGFFFEHDGPIK